MLPISLVVIINVFDQILETLNIKIGLPLAKECNSNFEGPFKKFSNSFVDRMFLMRLSNYFINVRHFTMNSDKFKEAEVASRKSTICKESNALKRGLIRSQSS